MQTGMFVDQIFNYHNLCRLSRINQTLRAASSNNEMIMGHSVVLQLSHLYFGLRLCPAWNGQFVVSVLSF